ncbi:leucine-rich repeat extensin-like protein 6 [Arachis stenosperma]|uniref:leucine-rich repeat extensin-like protein 6 n=1 Tax=Arachis stenosperma TaxID=217475 RepID=UPI0025AC8B46|nr:leucine-rich repeat extensin-like protein 6 [Arachis stenosperma]
MSILTKTIHQTKPPQLLILLINLILLLCVTSPILKVKALESRNLDETSNGQQKCTPCENPSPPSLPPPIVYPSPPPPPPVYPPPPPPAPKKPPSQNCPPPPYSPTTPSSPSSPYVYMTGPPGNLYPVDENFNGAYTHGFNLFLQLLCGFLIFFAFGYNNSS